MFKYICVILSVMLCVPAWANSAEDVRALISSGDYVQARTEAQNLNSAQGYALAAESLASQILLGEVDKLNLRSKEARELSEKALALNPDLYEAKLQYTLTDGFVTRTSGDFTAWRKKLPMKTYNKIQSFRTDYPDDPRGMALEAAWHMGIVRKAGKNSEKWFGASLTEGQRLYEFAIKANPNDILVVTNYAMSLLVLNAKDHADSARPILESVTQLIPSTHLDRKIQMRAKEVLESYEDHKQVEKLAAKFLDGK